MSGDRITDERLTQLRTTSLTAGVTKAELLGALLAERAEVDRLRAERPVSDVEYQALCEECSALRAQLDRAQARLGVEDDAEECGEPCSPDHPCSQCAEYWDRMIREGYWDDERHQWTNRGWKEICK